MTIDAELRDAEVAAIVAAAKTEDGYQCRWCRRNLQQPSGLMRHRAYCSWNPSLRDWDKDILVQSKSHCKICDASKYLRVMSRGRRKNDSETFALCLTLEMCQKINACLLAVKEEPASPSSLSPNSSPDGHQCEWCNRFFQNQKGVLRHKTYCAWNPLRLRGEFLIKINPCFSRFRISRKN